MTTGIARLLVALLWLVLAACQKAPEAPVAGPAPSPAPQDTAPTPLPAEPSRTAAVPPPAPSPATAAVPAPASSPPAVADPSNGRGPAAAPTTDPFATLAAPSLGSSVVRVPSTVKQGHETVARLIVSPDDLATLLAAPGVAGATDIRDRRAQVRLMPRMRAAIAAPGFAVEPKDVQEQLVKEGEPTEWLWTLVPETLGAHTLVFTLEGLTTVDGRDAVVRPPALTVPVTVEVSPLYFLGHYWQWLITAIVAPLVAFAGKRWLERRSVSSRGAADTTPDGREPGSAMQRR